MEFWAGVRTVRCCQYQSIRHKHRLILGVAVNGHEKQSKGRSEYWSGVTVRSEQVELGQTGSGTGKFEIANNMS